MASGDLYTFHVPVIFKEAYEIKDASKKLLTGLLPPIVDLEEDPSFLPDIIDYLAGILLSADKHTSCID